MAKRKPVIDTSYWVIMCHQSSMGTAHVVYECDEHGTLHKSGRAVLGSPPLPFEPGYQGIIKVTVELVKKGRKYPKNPFTQLGQGPA